MAAKNITLKVNGMTCEHCVETIESALWDIDGVFDARADLGAGTVSIEYDSSRIDAQAIHDVIEELGYKVA